MATTVKKVNLTTTTKAIKPTPKVSCGFMHQVNRNLRNKRNANAMKVRKQIDLAADILFWVFVAFLVWVL